MSYEAFNGKNKPMTYQELQEKLEPFRVAARLQWQEEDKLRKQYIEENRKFKNGQRVKVSGCYIHDAIVANAWFDVLGKDHSKIAYTINTPSHSGIVGVAEDRLELISQVEITDLKETDHGRICVDT